MSAVFDKQYREQELAKLRDLYRELQERNDARGGDKDIEDPLLRLIAALIRRAEIMKRKRAHRKYAIQFLYSRCGGAKRKTPTNVFCRSRALPFQNLQYGYETQQRVGRGDDER